VATAVRELIAAVGARTAFIEPGSPWENGYCERFHAKLRDELFDGIRPLSSVHWRTRSQSSTAWLTRGSWSRGGASTTTRSARTHPQAIGRQLRRLCRGRPHHPEPLRRPSRQQLPNPSCTGTETGPLNRGRSMSQAQVRARPRSSRLRTRDNTQHQSGGLGPAMERTYAGLLGTGEPHPPHLHDVVVRGTLNPVRVEKSPGSTRPHGRHYLPGRQRPSARASAEPRSLPRRGRGGREPGVLEADLRSP
jgi:hypothetical protein